MGTKTVIKIQKGKKVNVEDADKVSKTLEENGEDLDKSRILSTLYDSLDQYIQVWYKNICAMPFKLFSTM